MIGWLVVLLLVLLLAALAYGIWRLDKEQDELNKLRLQREKIAELQRQELRKHTELLKQDKSAAAKNKALNEEVK